MALLCLDIGNTSGHMGVLERGRVLRKWDVPTRNLIAANSIAREALEVARECDGVAFDSVVPAAAVGLRSLLEVMNLGKPVYELRWDDAPGLGFDYPNPPEVGQDRLANSIAAQAVGGPPTVVIDMGTATTFDVVTHRGYAGGIIAPGLALMAEYLHEKTALLPKLDRMDLVTESAIGKSTVEAMKIGANIGFRGMIREMLHAVLMDLESIGEHHAQVITTGGNAVVLPKGWWPGARHIPDLSLLGLEEAFIRKQLASKH